METRLTRKRHQTAPHLSTAKRYLGLEFGDISPSPKKRKLESTPAKRDTLTTRSFYGNREKKNFPHSPGRRKAAHKILDKLSDENTDSDQDRVKTGNSRKVNSHSSFDFHSTSTSDTTDNEEERRRKRPLREQNSQKKHKRSKKVPLDIITSRRTPKNKMSDKVTSMSTGKLMKKVDREPFRDDQKTPIITGKKFFKTRSPGSTAMLTGGIVGKKGFDLKFVARKLKVSGTPSRIKEAMKLSSKTVPVKKVTGSKDSRFKDGIILVSDSEQSNNEQEQIVLSDNVEEPEYTASRLEQPGVKEAENTVEMFDVSEPEYIATRLEPSDVNKDSAIDTANSSDLFSSSQAIDEGNNQLNLHSLNRQVDNDNSLGLDSLKDGSEDLFSAVSESGRSTPSLSTPTASDPSTPVSTAGSDSKSSVVSGVVTNLQEKKFFPIFRQQASPTSSSQRNKLRSSKNSSPAISPLLRSSRNKDNMEQMVIDAGQKKFGVTQCDTCGMVYNIADPDDETTHYNYHQSALSALKFPGWKKENVVQEYPMDGSRVLKVSYDSPKHALKKIEEVNLIMSQELGSGEVKFNFRPSYQAFLYISDNRRIEGCCIAEPLTEGYPVVPDSDSSQSSQSHPGNRPWYCSDMPETAKVGISRIWVHNLARRKGIATKLLDCVRHWFSYGCVISKKKIAFSDPTQNGKTLAMKYTGRDKFLVYKFVK